MKYSFKYYDRWDLKRMHVLLLPFSEEFSSRIGTFAWFLISGSEKMMIFDLQWNLMESCILVTEALIT